MRDFTDEPALLRAAAGHTRSSDHGSAHDHTGFPPTVQTLLTLQRTAGNSGVASALAADEEERSPVLDIVGKGGGRPLDPLVRTGMESRFGTDFSDVRVHTDSAAASSATAVQAQAYTVGSDIVFGAGSHSPESDQGQRTLAHELTHVVQQRAGAVDGTPTGGGVSVSDPSDRFERQAEATADAVLGAGPVGAEPAENPAAATTGAAVQREELAEEEEEEPVQTLAIQRQEGPEEEEEQQEYTA